MNADAQTDTPLPTRPGGRGSGSGTALLKPALVLAALLVLFLIGRQAADAVTGFAAWVESLGVWGPVAFALGYALASVAFVPGSFLTLAAGAIFGLGEGVAVVLVGATLGACLSFLIARYVAREAIETRLEGNEKFRRIDAAVGREGLKIVTLLRLSPAFPFNLLNYGLGLTRVRFDHYAIACLGMLPGTFLYVYYGKAVGDFAALASRTRPETGSGQWILLGLGLAATIAVTGIVTRIARNALRGEVEA